VSFGILSLVHYDPSALHHSVSDEHNIRLVGFGIPCLLSAVVALLYLTHPITRAMQLRNRETIEARNTAGLSVGGEESACVDDDAIIFRARVDGAVREEPGQG